MLRYGCKQGSVLCESIENDVTKDEDNVKTIMSNVLRHYVYFSTGSAQVFCQSNKMVVCVNIDTLTRSILNEHHRSDMISIHFSNPLDFLRIFISIHTMSLFCLFNVYNVRAKQQSISMPIYEQANKMLFPKLETFILKAFSEPANNHANT